MERTLILGLETHIFSGLGCLLMGSGAGYMAFLAIRDAQARQGKFSTRYQAAFGSWKINRAIVRFNAWIELLMLTAAAPFLIGLGIKLLSY